MLKGGPKDRRLGASTNGARARGSSQLSDGGRERNAPIGSTLGSSTTLKIDSSGNRGGLEGGGDPFLFNPDFNRSFSLFCSDNTIDEISTE